MKNLFIFFIGCFLSIFVSGNLLAQDATIQGTVLDDEGYEVIGGTVTYLLNGQTVGTTTDIDGKYSVQVPAGSYTMEFGYVGFDPVGKDVTVSAGEVLVLDMAFSTESTSMLDEVVVTESKYAKKSGESMVTLAVLPDELLENNVNVSLDESIEKAPGVTVIGGQANIRGGSGFSYGAGSRVLLLYDDMPMLTGDAGFPYWDFVPMENTEQIEIIKGASSALYGSSALNGIVNVRTKYAKGKPELKFSAYTGVYENPRNNIVIDTVDTGIPGVPAIITEKDKRWWNDRANDTTLLTDPIIDQPFYAGTFFNYSRKIGKKLDFVVGSHLYQRESWRKHEYQKRGRINTGIRYRFTEKLAAGVNINGQINRTGTYLLWNGTGAEMYQLWNQTTPIDNNRFQMTIDPFVQYTTNSGMQHKLRMRYFKNDNVTNTNQSILSDMVYGEYQFYLPLRDQSINLTAGLVGMLSFAEAELYGDTVFTADNYAAYMQVDKKFFDKMSIAFGARYEMNRTNEDDWTAKPVFRLGVNYQVADYTYLRGSFGQGYRHPTIAEKFVDTNVGLIDIAGNNTLREETGWSSELGIKQGVALGENWQGFVDIAGFWTEYQDMMEFTFGTIDGVEDNAVGFQTKNVGDTKILGGELTVAGKGDVGFADVTVLAGYTYIDPTFKVWADEGETVASLDAKLADLEEAGQVGTETYNTTLTQRDNLKDTSADENILKYRFKHSAKGDIQFDMGKLGFGFSGQYNSFMQAVDQTFIDILPGLKTYREQNPGGEAVFDARIMYDINDHHNITFMAKNVFNNEYAVRPALIEAPRTWIVRYTFNL